MYEDSSYILMSTYSYKSDKEGNINKRVSKKE